MVTESVTIYLTVKDYVLLFTQDTGQQKTLKNKKGSLPCLH